VLTASATVQCLFEAFGLALQLLDAQVDGYGKELEVFGRALAERGVDINAGVKWKVFAAFVRRVIGLSSRVDLKTLHASGHRYHDAIDRLDLSDGVYIIGAFNSRRVGHAFVLNVAGGEWTVIGADGQSGFKDYGA